MCSSDLLRKQLAAQSGYLLPPLKVSDNLNLNSREYRILLRGAEIARFELLAGHVLAIPGAHAQPLREAKPTLDPAFGQPASWVPSALADESRTRGYTVVDATSVIGAHLAEIIKKYSCEMFSRQDAKNYCDRVAQENPKVVEDLVPKLLSLAAVQRVLQNLLKERVPIRDSTLILEALSEAAATTRNQVLLTEFVRQSIRRVLVEPHLLPGRELRVAVLEPETEEAVEKSVHHHDQTSVSSMPPHQVRGLVDEARRKTGNGDACSVLLTTTGARYFVRQVLESYLPGITVLSHAELPSEVKILVVGRENAGSLVASGVGV